MTEEPIEILKKRLAEGEITKEEFEERKKVLDRKNVEDASKKGENEDQNGKEVVSGWWGSMELDTEEGTESQIKAAKSFALFMSYGIPIIILLLVISSI